MGWSHLFMSMTFIHFKLTHCGLCNIHMYFGGEGVGVVDGGGWVDSH